MTSQAPSSRAGMRTGAVAVVLLASLCGSACMLPLKREKFEKIQLGMSEDEVRKIVGRPNAITKMDTMPAGYEDIPFEDYEQYHRRPPEQFMWTYTSGMEFAQVYFEDKHVFGVRFNNEFLKGDWMEGERMPSEVLPPGGSAYTPPPEYDESPSYEAPSSDEPYEAPSDGSESP